MSDIVYLGECFEQLLSEFSLFKPQQILLAPANAGNRN